MIILLDILMHTKIMDNVSIHVLKQPLKVR